MTNLERDEEYLRLLISKVGEINYIIFKGIRSKKLQKCNYKIVDYLIEESGEFVNVTITSSYYTKMFKLLKKNFIRLKLKDNLLTLVKIIKDEKQIDKKQVDLFESFFWFTSIDDSEILFKEDLLIEFIKKKFIKV